PDGPPRRARSSNLGLAWRWTSEPIPVQIPCHPARRDSAGGVGAGFSLAGIRGRRNSRGRVASGLRDPAAEKCDDVVQLVVREHVPEMGHEAALATEHVED